LSKEFLKDTAVVLKWHLEHMAAGNPFPFSFYVTNELQIQSEYRQWTIRITISSSATFSVRIFYIDLPKL
jgi:hypothetical protein